MPGGAVAAIIIGSILFVSGGLFAVAFFLLNKWIIVDDKAVRVFKLNKKDDKNKLFTMKFQTQNRVDEEVFNSKDDAEEFLENQKK